MLDVYTFVVSSRSKLRASFLTNVIRVQAPKIKRGIFVSNWCIRILTELYFFMLRF